MTILTRSPGASGTFAFDLRLRQVRLGSHSTVVSQRCIELLQALNDARASGSDAGAWAVFTEEIATLPSWHAKRERSRSSLGAEIRREVKSLQRRGLDVVATAPRCLTTGPYWLKVPAYRRGRSAVREKRAASVTAPQQFARWLAITEPVWWSLYLWDKEGSNLTTAPDLSGISDEFGPIPRALAAIDVSRRMREAGGYDTAVSALVLSHGLTQRVTNPFIRTYLEATCHLHRAWTAYRQADLPQAERFLNRGFQAVDSQGHGHLRVRGRLLTVRSLIRRKRGLFDLALKDLWASAECAFVVSDLYTLASSYQNFAYLVEEIADLPGNAKECEDLIQLALQYSRKNSELRKKLRAGFNSVVADVHRAHLLGRLGRHREGIAVADEAFDAARRARNWPNVHEAHFERIGLRLAMGLSRQADELQRRFIEKHCSTQSERTRAKARYDQLRREAPAPHDS